MPKSQERLYLIYYELDESGNESQRFVDLDIITDTSITLNSIVTRYPLIEGDSISDHMYRQPGEISISGIFSENGRFTKSIEATYTERLKYIQKLFEDIKDNKLFVDIISLYTRRNNYVLSNIQWNEDANTLGYTFTFNQIYLATTSEVEYVVDVRDENLPPLQDVNQLDFIGEVLRPGDIEEVVLVVLQQLNLVSTEFLLDFAATFYGSVAAGIGVGFAIKAAIAAKIAIASGPIGWAVLGVAVLIGFGISKAIQQYQAISSRNSIKAFTLKSNARANEAEQKRFAQFLQEMHNEIVVLNNNVNAYSLRNNIPQEVILNIANQYYSFSFTKNNSDNSWSLIVSNLNDEVISTQTKVVGISSLDECTYSNNILSQIDGVQLFIFDKRKLTVSEGAEITLQDDSETQLTDLIILVSNIDLTQWYNIVYDIIENAVTI
jgi:hypothetical protein